MKDDKRYEESKARGDKWARLPKTPTYGHGEAREGRITSVSHDATSGLPPEFENLAFLIEKHGHGIKALEAELAKLKATSGGQKRKRN